MKAAIHGFLLKKNAGRHKGRSGYYLDYHVKVILLLQFFLMISFVADAQITDNKSDKKGGTDAGLTVLYNFDLATDGQNYITTDIAFIAPYVFLDFYDGGIMGYGSIVRIKTDGTNFTRWWTWDTPIWDIEASGTFLYGTRRLGGTNDNGTIFRTGVYGTDWSTIFNFPAYYSFPYYDIVVNDTVIVGIAQEHLQPYGYLFSLKTDGTDFKNLLDTYGLYPTVYFVFDNYLYGTIWDNGTIKIFRLSADGAEFTIMDYFNTPGSGINPGSLVLIDNYIYGITTEGGTYGYGTLWRIRPDGTEFRILYSFTSNDGLAGKIMFHGSHIYGVSAEGGDAGMGRIFRFKKDGTGHLNIYDFNDSGNGYYPGDFVMSGDTIFGVTFLGGANGMGTLYRFVDDIPDPVNELIKVKKLALKAPEEIELNTKGELTVEKGHYLNLDTTFTATGNVAYTYDWKIKSGGSYQLVNNTVQVNYDCTYYIFLNTIEGCSYVDSLVVQAKAATGISETEIYDNIRIYPNPNRGNFYLKLSEGCERCLYKIYDQSGAGIYSGEIDCESNDCLCNIVLDNLKPGTYTFTVTKGSAVLSKQKFVIIGD